MSKSRLKDVVLQVAILTTGVAVADSKVINGVTWRYCENDGGITLCNGTYDEWDDPDWGPTVDEDVAGDLVVPSEINGLPVTLIGDGAFDGCRMITSITIPETVEKIGRAAVRGCSSLTNLVLSEGLQRICHSAFIGCPLLDRILLPNSLRDVEYGRISTAARIELKPDHPKYKIMGDAIYDKRGITLINYFGHSKHVVIPDGIKRIGERAFAYSEVESVVFPETLEEIGEESFEDCEELITLDLPEKVRKIKSNAFRCCRSLTGVFYQGPRCEIADDSFRCCGLVVSFVQRNKNWENAAGVLAGCQHRKGDAFENEYWDGNLDRTQKLERVIAHLAKRKNVESKKILARLYGDKTLPTYDQKRYFSVLSDAVKMRHNENWRTKCALAWIKDRIGLCYRDGIGCAVDAKQAQQWFLESNTSEAIFHLAEMLMASATSEEMRNSAFVLAMASCTRGSGFAKSYIQLGKWCLAGNCRILNKSNVASALEMFQRATEDSSISHEEMGYIASQIQKLRQSQLSCRDAQDLHKDKQKSKQGWELERESQAAQLRAIQKELQWMRVAYEKDRK